MSLDVRTGFSGRTIFMTGGTGFVGKVTLYKILKETPDVRRVYLLMRGRKSRKFKRYLNPAERLELEILQSPCFEPLRQRIGQAKWKELCGKVHGVNGDITEDHLGLSAKDRQTIASEVNFIVHLAATVNFNERLDLAVQMNTLGGLRVLALAKTCTKLEAMVHVSTCYVNYPRNGRANVNMETMYDMDFDSESVVKHILNLDPSEVPAESARILKQYGFGNTYCFTKNMGEKLVYKYRENVPVVVVRPSIIGCSYAEPMPGWVDALTAAGGLILTGGLGVVRELQCDGSLIADVIPVDFVVNVILKALFKTQQHYQAQRRSSLPAETTTTAAATSAVAAPLRLPAGKGAVAPAGSAASVAGRHNVEVAAAPTGSTTTTATAGEDERLAAMPAASTNAGDFPFIYQACVTGTDNTACWQRLTNALYRYLDGRKHPKGLSKCEVTLTTSRAYYEARYWTLRYLPFLGLKAMMQMPEPIGSAKKRQLVEKLGRAVRRSYLLNREFKEFIDREWFYDSTNTFHLDDGLNEYSKKAFSFDPYGIQWFYYVHLYFYGILKHIVHDTAFLAEPKPPQTATQLFQRASSL